ncbi:MAG: hypothetical protein ACLQUT_06635 [Thermoleophilia bacterium]
MTRKTLVTLVLAGLLGIGLAVAFSHGSPVSQAASGLSGGSSASGQQVGVAATGGGAITAATNPLAVDPAKQQPVLDQFTSKDPFYDNSVGIASTSSTASPTPVPTSPSTPTPTPTSTSATVAPTGAKIAINGTAYTVKTGDKVPVASPLFTISSISDPAGVTFTPLSGTFDSGATALVVAAGASATDGYRGTTYKFDVTQLTYPSTGGSSTPSTNTIQLTQINTLNGESSANFVVNGTTYANKVVGDVFTTSWGQIKVLGINAGAQTVTILHGDATLVLSKGQSVTK